MEQEIPFELRAPTKKALQWLNRENNSDYDLTGLVGAEKVSDLSKPFEIGLILCDGELCARKQIAFTPTNKGFIFSQIELEAPSGGQCCCCGIRSLLVAELVLGWEGLLTAAENH